MKAKVHGIEVEGTLEEIIEFKRQMDEQEKQKHFKVTINYFPKNPSDATDLITEFMKIYPTHTYI